MTDEYSDAIRKIRALHIVTSLHARKDLRAFRLLKQFTKELQWEPRRDLLIDDEAWDYVVNQKHYDPKMVFCHPEILLQSPETSLYYRGLSALSLKAAREYFGAVEKLEAGSRSARISKEKAKKMACTYNLLVCSVIRNSTAWTLANGQRTVIATLGITLDGGMRNRIGQIAEQRIRTLVLEWLLERDLIVEPKVSKRHIYGGDFPRDYQLKAGLKMGFSSEPDISFSRDENLIAVVEIKGGIDPAGALERYGAATKSFQHSVDNSARCKNFYLAGVITPEVDRRIRDDRLVEKTFNIVEILDHPLVREDFFDELFHHAIRLT